MTKLQSVFRYLGLVGLLAVAGLAAHGLIAMRKDLHSLRAISQDNILWSATQMEVELLKFGSSLTRLTRSQTESALEAMHERFDILWSRVFMIAKGPVGRQLRVYDEKHEIVASLADYLEDIDGTITGLSADDVDTMESVLDTITGYQDALRTYTLQVVRGETAAAERLRDRIQAGAHRIGVLSIVAVPLCVLSLVLILRDNARQQKMADLSRRIASEAERSSRAKSNFLTMMSHELRNPLNGVLGPLALLSQSNLPTPHQRLVGRAQSSGKTMLQLLSGLLDYGEMQDGKLSLKAEPFRIAALADAIAQTFRNQEAGDVRVSIKPGITDLIYGDLDRLRQIFVCLAEYVLEAGDASALAIELNFDGKNLIGELGFMVEGKLIERKLDVIVGLNDTAPDQVSSEALRPVIARGLISAANGTLSLANPSDGRRVILVRIPAKPVKFNQIRVHLETRSAALQTIYRAALKNDRVAFAGEESSAVDIVLVDATSTGTDGFMSNLRRKYPGALFVSLGLPQAPDLFDDVVERPNDIPRLRKSILDRLAS